MPTATHLSIANAVKTAIDALAISSLTTIVRAKTTRGSGDTMPLCIVTMGAERDEGYLTGGCILRGYEIIITVMEVANQLFQTSLDGSKLVRETIRTGLFPSPSASPILTGVTSIWRVEVGDMAVQNSGDFDANYQTAQMGLVYQNSEAL